MPLRCAYTDLDGTLLGRYGSLFRDAEGNFSMLQARALEACHRADVEVVIKSGRREPQVLEDARLIGSTAYIYEAGCAVMMDGEATVLIGDFRADEGRTAFEIFKAVRRPFEQSLVATGGICEQLLTFFGDRRIGSGGSGQRTIKVIFRLQELGGDGPQQSLHLFRQGRCATMLGRVDIRLQFEDPIPDRVNARARAQLGTLQIVLEVVLVDLLTAKRSEDGGQPPQRPDETELPRHEIEQRRVARSLREPPSSLLGLVVHIRERLSAGETMRHQSAVDPHEVER